MFRKFFYAAAGVFLLALSFHLGNTTATAQGTGQFVALCMNADSRLVALTSDGRVYAAPSYSVLGTWHFQGTISSGPTPTTSQSWGQVKERYR
jgi:hypothetical protein